MCKCIPRTRIAPPQPEQESIFWTVFAGWLRFGGIFRRSLRLWGRRLKKSSTFWQKSAPPQTKFWLLLWRSTTVTDSITPLPGQESIFMSGKFFSQRAVKNWNLRMSWTLRLWTSSRTVWTSSGKDMDIKSMAYPAHHCMRTSTSTDYSIDSWVERFHSGNFFLTFSTFPTRTVQSHEDKGTAWTIYTTSR